MELDNLYFKLASLGKTSSIGLGSDFLDSEQENWVVLEEACALGTVDLRKYRPEENPGLAPLRGLSSAGSLISRQALESCLNALCRSGLVFLFVESGSLELFFSDNKTEKLNPGSLLIVRPWQRNQIVRHRLEKGAFYWFSLDIKAVWPNQDWTWPDWVILTFENREALSLLLRQNDFYSLFCEKRLSRSFQDLIGVIRSEDSLYFASQLGIGVNDLLINLLAQIFENDLTPNQSLSTALHTVELYLTNIKNNLSELRKPRTVERMSAECGICPTLLTDYCRQITGQTPADFLRSERIRSASALLECDPQLSVTEIARLCGFQTAAYFSTAFRRETGLSPRQYRNQKQGVPQ